MDLEATLTKISQESSKLLRVELSVGTLVPFQI
jgi:hypothetical protein